jgi:hypothetical protein
MKQLQGAITSPPEPRLWPSGSIHSPGLKNLERFVSRQNRLTIKTLGDAVAIRNQLITHLEEANVFPNRSVPLVRSLSCSCPNNCPSHRKQCR